ncbi:MAG: hypothetical protein PHY30_03050 [Candidatus Pacebacteria bacterium]|nr:hypothetical protein [Candidatus Paceibacterota bacterium]
MNKENLLIFSLSGVLFLTVSFIVYSWSEPTGNMPSTYTPPINESIVAQYKRGILGAQEFRDSDNNGYYINPSGDSVISGSITTSGNIVTARPTEADQVTTKGYVDEQIALVRAIVSGAQTLVNGAHTWSECEAAGGTVEDSDVELKLCRFEAATCPSEGGWNQYKNFSRATECQVTCSCNDACIASTAPGHEWGNQAPAVTGCNVNCTYNKRKKEYVCGPTCTGYDCDIHGCCYIVTNRHNCSANIVEIGCF